MMKGFLLGGALWAAALLGSYLLGQSQSEELDSELPAIRVREVELSRGVASVRSREDFVRGFDSLLPERADVFKHDELWLLADEWAAQEPEAAVAWLSELEFDDVRNPYLFAALSQWASQDPEQARAWLLSHRPEVEESALYLNAGFIRGVARQDPEAAVAFLLEQPKRVGRSTIDFVLGAWAQDGVSRLLSGVLALPADRADLRIHALEKAAAHLSPEMLVEARELSQTLRDEKEREALQAALADRWAQRSPEEAMEWAQGLAQPQAIGRVAKHWARQEPVKASDWLARREGTPEYDVSARAVAWSVVGIDAERAFSQVAEMRSQSLRLETFEQMGRFWLSDQPKVARAFLEGENPLPPKLRAALLSHFE